MMEDQKKTFHQNQTHSHRSDINSIFFTEIKISISDLWGGPTKTASSREVRFSSGLRWVCDLN
jgi:hypothetical protein